jgi:hypothetical protein
MPPQDRAGSDDQPHSREALGRQCPGEQRQPRPVQPRQPRMHPRSLPLRDNELMAQHQDLGVLPPPLPPRQAQHRRRTEHDQEDKLQAHKPKIIPRPARTGPASAERWTKPTVLRKASSQVTQVFGTHKYRSADLRRCCSVRLRRVPSPTPLVQLCCNPRKLVRIGDRSIQSECRRGPEASSSYNCLQQSARYARPRTRGNS